MGTGAAATRQERVQLVGQSDGGAIVEIDSGKTIEQRENTRRRKAAMANGVSKHETKKIRGSRRETLIETLARDIEAKRGSGDNKLFQGGVGEIEPAEDAGLEERGAGEDALAFDKARRRGDRISKGSEEPM